MSWSGEGVECEAMVQPSDGHVFERWERAVVTVALGSSCLQDEGSATRISVELSGSNLARGSLSFSWSVEPHLLKDQGLDLELPSSLPDDEYRGNLVIQRLSMPVHFWSISMAEPKISVVFPVDGFAFGRESRPWVQILVSDTTLQEELGVREVRYNVKVAANGTFLADVSSANGNKIYLALPFGVHKVHFSVYDVMWRSTGVMASVLVNVTALLSDVAPPIPDRGLGNVARCPPSESCRTDAECSGRGRCSAGACLCKGDYAGEQCEVSLLESPSFLPALDPRTAPSRCRKARHQASFASEILAKHAPLQHPVECDASTVFLQSRSTRGLGLTLRWLGLAMSEAIVRRKALVIDGMWSWFDFEGCSEGMGCYLTPVSNCTPDDVWRPPPTGGDLSHLADQGKEYVASAKSGELDGRARVGDVMEGHMRKLLEIPRAALGGGLLWWTSSTIAQVGVPSPALVATSALSTTILATLSDALILLAFAGTPQLLIVRVAEQVVRPTERLRALVKSAMNDVGWRQPAIGMHVRRGDSCADWSRPAPCVPLANYLRACRDMAAKYGARSVFIATDSADVVGEARTA